MSRAIRIALVAVLVLIPLSCSDDDPTAPEPANPSTATKTIPPTGGSIRVENEAGVSLNVTLPSGAVLTPTSVTLRSVTPPSGVRARFAIEPAGLDLLAPATITVTIPDGTSIDPNDGLSFVSGETIRVPTDVDTQARTLRASLYHLGFDLPVPPTALATATPDGSEFIDVDAITCQLMFESLTDAILRAQSLSSPFPPTLASPLILQYRAMLIGCPQSEDMANITAALEQFACSNKSSAEAQAGQQVQSVDDFKRSLGDLLSAEALVQTAGVDCHIDNNVVESVFNKYLDSYIARIEDPGFTASFENWDMLWRELVPVVELKALADEFELSGPSERIDDQLFPALFARLREVAGEACEDDGNSGLLADMLTGGHALNHPIAPTAQLPPFTGFSQPELLDQYHRCGSSLSFQTRSPQGDVIDVVSVQGTTSASITVIKDGNIAIEDELLGLMCGDVLARDVVRIFAEIPGSLPTAPLGDFNGDRTLQVSTILNALPGDEATNFDLVFTRDRSQCGIENGGTQRIELYRVTVIVLGGAGDISGTWGGECASGTIGGTFDANIDNNGTVTGTFDGDVSGGISGFVNGDGTFNATASGAAGSCTWTGTVSGFGANLTGEGSWGGCGTCSGGWSSGTSVPN